MVDKSNSGRLRFDKSNFPFLIFSFCLGLFSAFLFYCVLMNCFDAPTLENLKTELQKEYETTKKFVDTFPEGKNDYAPHEKSMKMMPLATHLVEIFAWPEIILNTEKLDFAAGDYKPSFLENKTALIQKLEDDYRHGKTALENAKEEDLDKKWTMNNGEAVLMDFNKYSATRHALDQITHHRAQLGIYYRLNDIRVPGSYGPSADEQSF